MRTTVAFCIIACFLGVLEALPQKPKIDNVDIDSVLSNDRILTNYIKCLLEKGPCTSEGRELKKLLPDALSSDCSKCSAMQKKNSGKVITYLRTHKPNEWKTLLAKFDPEGVYAAKYGPDGAGFGS